MTNAAATTDKRKTQKTGPGPTTTTATSKPITPKPRREPLPRPALITNPLAAYHPSQLIVEIENGPGPKDRLSEVEIVKQINEVLQSADESRRLRVVNVKFNAHNNCIVFTRADQSAGDLATFAENFIQYIAGDRPTRVRPDERWYKVQLNGVRVRNERSGEVRTPQDIENKLRALNPDYARMEVHDLPRWMRHRADIEYNTHSSVVLALKTEADTTFLVTRVQNLAIGGNFAQAKRYADKPPAMQCSQCWEFGHTQTRCKKTERCRICGKDDHSEANHICTECIGVNGDDISMATGMPVHHSHSRDRVCANCNGPHTATFRNCSVRERAAGMTKSKPNKGNKAAQKGGWIEVTPNPITPSQAKRRDAQAAVTEQNRFAVLEAENEKRLVEHLEALTKRFPDADKDECRATLELADGDFQRAVAMMSALGPTPHQSPLMTAMQIEEPNDE